MKQLLKSVQSRDFKKQAEARLKEEKTKAQTEICSMLSQRAHCITVKDIIIERVVKNHLANFDL